MAKDRVERQLDNLKAIRALGPSDTALKELQKSLGDSVNVIVAKAASIVDEWQSRVLLPDLLAAYDRMFLKGGQSDPQCWAKNALSHALKNFGYSESERFLRGLHWFQLESTWGGKVDTAGVLRGTCALALVQCNDIIRGSILTHLVDAVTEPEARVRADAARALEQMDGPDVTLLLRLKARAGDREARVTGQVLESLLQLEGGAAVTFVAAFLNQGDEELREEAALALGASRLLEAVELLKNEWLQLNGRGTGAELLRGLSVSRLDAALDFLIEQVCTARARVAEEALKALDLHRDSEEIVKRVKEAVSNREELAALFMEKFG